jgi:hypothetical protein
MSWPPPLQQQKTEMKGEKKVRLSQGDKIGRIFARWAILYFDIFFFKIILK